ncbi:lachesin-like [Schistocerca gregaria]|uniref:lachesin-like n=1 Tax=Schistocerca gregaria TaxID=7010 RepID=UPI00211E110B|nr:lachesin-like [Schistocerca gregaria]
MWALLFLLAAALATVAGQVAEEPAPVFLAPLDNVTATQGRDVSFTCVVDHLGEYKVAWIKSDSKAILAIHTHMVAHNPRLAVTHNGHNTWRLHVSNVQRADSGSYMCQVNTDPMKYMTGHLEVVVPPDIVDDGASAASAAPEGGSVRMRCTATGDPPPSVIWKREDGRDIVLRLPDGRQAQHQVEGDTLLLSGVTRADMGVYLCVASNGVPPAVSKRFPVSVHFHPLIKVTNQLVLAPQGSDVVLQCYVEASPRALNSWHRETGEKLMANTGGKYVIRETQLNEYAVLMNLTVRDVHAADFGSYTCSSVNALGRVEGTVRLQELYLPRSTSRPDQHAAGGKGLSRPKAPPPHTKAEAGGGGRGAHKHHHAGKRNRQQQLPYRHHDLGPEDDEELGLYGALGGAAGHDHDRDRDRMRDPLLERAAPARASTAPPPGLANSLDAGAAAVGCPRSTTLLASLLVVALPALFSH